MAPKSKKRADASDSDGEHGSDKEYEAKPKQKRAKAADIPTDRAVDGWWHVKDPGLLIHKTFGNPEPSTKIAAFDWDSTLIVDRFGPDKSSALKKGLYEWKFFNKEVPEKLKEYVDSGYRIVVFSNQGTIKTALGGKAATGKKQRMEEMAKDLPNIPFVALMAPAATSANDPFRKPERGMWDYFKEHMNGGLEIDMGASFFCGDAAGRPGDFAASDREFAAKCKLEFKLPEDVFGEPDFKKRIEDKALLSDGAAASYEGPNSGLVEMFTKLINKVADEENGFFKAGAYKKARAAIIAKGDEEIKHSNDLKGLQGVGKGTLAKVQTFLDTGGLPELDGDVGADGSVPKKETGPKKTSKAAAFL